MRLPKVFIIAKCISIRIDDYTITNDYSNAEPRINDILILRSVCLQFPRTTRPDQTRQGQNLSSNSLRRPRRSTLRPKKPLPPLPTNSLKPTNNITADPPSLAILQPPIPIAALKPPRPFLEALFVAPQLRDQFAGGAEPARGGGGELAGFVEGVA